MAKTLMCSNLLPKLGDMFTAFLRSVIGWELLHVLLDGTSFVCMHTYLSHCL